MNIKEKAEKLAATAVINTVLQIIDKDPEKNVDKIFAAIKKFVKDEDQKKQIDNVCQYYNENPAVKEFIQGILKTTNKKALKKFFTNFFVNGVWLSASKREKYMEEENVKIPFIMLISPSMRCNIHCTGCYAASFSKKDDMSPEEVDRLIGEARDLGIHWIVVLGGEPFFNKYMLDLYEKYNDVMFTPFTNGTLIDEETADRLAKAGNVIPMLSVEGSEEATDGRRGKGVYQKVMHAMDLLNERGVLFGVSTAATSQNIESVTSDEFTDLMISKGSKMCWYFIFMPVGDAKPDFSLMLSPEQRLYLGKRVREIRKTKPYFTLDFFNDAPYVGGCIAGKYYFHINSKGNVEPCIFSHFSTQNAIGKPLIDVLRDPFFRIMREKQPYNKNMLKPCSMIDNPGFIRQIVKEAGAKPDDEGADAMINDPEFKATLNQIAKEFTPYADKERKEVFHEKGNMQFSTGHSKKLNGKLDK